MQSISLLICFAFFMIPSLVHAAEDGKSAPRRPSDSTIQGNEGTSAGTGWPQGKVLVPTKKSEKKSVGGAAADPKRGGTGYKAWNPPPPSAILDTPGTEPLVPGATPRNSSLRS